MLHMCVCMHSRFVENHPIRILEDGPFISEVVLSQMVFILIRASIPGAKSPVSHSTTANRVVICRISTEMSPLSEISLGIR
jgi:hypothetical protein